MAAIQSGTCVVRNASTTVYHVWTLVISTTSGTFAADEAVTWGADGVGVFLSYEPALKHLRVYRTSDPNTTDAPAAGMTVEAAGSGATAVIAQLGPGTPGKWNLGTVGANPVYFHTPAHGVAYQVASFNATDRLQLSTAYAGADDDDIPYSVTQDYTANFGFPIVALGDVDAATVMSLAMSMVDSTMQKILKGEMNFVLSPTDPGVAGWLWNDNGTVKRSAG